jgi:CspA family cold shock protein
MSSLSQLSHKMSDEHDQQLLEDELPDLGSLSITQPLPSPTNAGQVNEEVGPIEVNRSEGESLDGTLKVWNVDKGFGFVTMEDGGPDLFVHQSAVNVEGDRYRAILPGTPLTCVYYLREGKETAREVCQKGGASLPGFSSKLEAAQKLSLASTLAGRPGVLTGTIKFMNKDKGFGFIIPDAGGDDMFVHVGDIDGQQILNQVPSPTLLLFPITLVLPSSFRTFAALLCICFVYLVQFRVPRSPPSSIP